MRVPCVVGCRPRRTPFALYRSGRAPTCSAARSRRLSFGRCSRDEIRTSFRDFFAARDHVVVPSASLVPPSLDPTVLLTTAGMQPFKPYFLGLRRRRGRALTSIQQCFRTHRHRGRRPDRAAPHVLRDDGQLLASATTSRKAPSRSPGSCRCRAGRWIRSGIWVDGLRGRRRVAAATTRRASCGARSASRPSASSALGEDNFWKAGPTGPLRPVQRALLRPRPRARLRPAAGGGPDECGPQCDCDRCLEFWNLVFMQYDRATTGPDAAAEAVHRHRRRRRAHLGAAAGRPSVYEIDALPAADHPRASPVGREYTDGGVAMRAARAGRPRPRHGVARHRRRDPVERAARLHPAPHHPPRGPAGRPHRPAVAVPDEAARGGRRTSLGEVYPDLVQHRGDVAESWMARRSASSRTLADRHGASSTM